MMKTPYMLIVGEKEMNEQNNEVRFENAVNRLDERFMANEMEQEEYDFLYQELVKKFGYA